MGKLLFEDLTYLIRKCIFAVQNEIGVGFDEETYHQGLIRRFKQEGIDCVSKERITLRHRDFPIRKFELDFLIENKVILSLKCIPCDFLQTNYVQLFAELKLWKKQLGLLVNFGLPKIKIVRLIFHEKPLVIDQHFKHVELVTTEAERKIIKLLHEAILFVGEEHGLGFGKPLMKHLIEAELKYRKIEFENGFVIPVNYLTETIRNYKMRDLLIEKRIVLAITALQNSINHSDISRIKSYLKALNLSIGLVVNFSKSKLEIRGVSHTRIEKLHG